MTGSIILNQNNLSPNGVFNNTTNTPPFNKLTYNLRGMNLTGRKIALKKINLYYSWPNVRQGVAITIQWPTGSSYTSATWTLPTYTNYAGVDKLNEALQNFCIANGFYLINGTSNVYYIELVANETTYQIDLKLYKVPTSLPAGYTAPSNFAGYPTTSKTMKMTIPTGSELSGLIGFADNTTYDGNTSAITYSSVYVPQMNPVSCIFITCNIAKNDVPLNGSTVIQCFTTSGYSYGNMITIEPNAQLEFYEIDTNSNNLEIRLWDQNWSPLYVEDPQITVHLVIQSHN